jgi:hypothetical protein
MGQSRVQGDGLLELLQERFGCGTFQGLETNKGGSSEGSNKQERLDKYKNNILRRAEYNAKEQPYVNN